VIHTDINCLSVMQYAIDILKVKHIIVCGHYGCGGVRAALENRQHGLIDNWLRNIQEVYRHHQRELQSMPVADDVLNRLCELNVAWQTLNVGHTTVVQEAWARGQAVAVHGWVYGLADGLLKNLEVSLSSVDELQRLEHKLRTL